MKRLFFYLSLYKDFVLQYWKTLMASPLNLWLGLGAFLVTQAGGLLFLVFVFDRIPDLNGWSLAQLLFIYGFANLPRGLDHVFTNWIWLLSNRVILQGDFDRYLLRPVSPLFQVVAEELQADGLGEILVGLIVVALALPLLEIEITAGAVVLFVLLVLAGAVIYTSIKLTFASLAFWIKDSFPLLNIAYMFSDFAKYPDGIYPKPVSLFLSFALPFSFTAFVPASYFLGTGSLPGAVGGTLVAALATALVARLVWKRGLRAYESAGN